MAVLLPLALDFTEVLAGLDLAVRRCAEALARFEEDFTRAWTAAFPSPSAALLSPEVSPMATPRRIALRMVPCHALAAPLAHLKAHELRVDADRPVYLVMVTGPTREPVHAVTQALTQAGLQGQGVYVPHGHEVMVHVLDLPAPGDPGPADHGPCDRTHGRLLDECESLLDENARLRAQLATAEGRAADSAQVTINILHEGGVALPEGLADEIMASLHGACDRVGLRLTPNLPPGADDR